MSAGLVRVAVLLCAVAAVTRAAWIEHGNPPGTKISTAMAPLIPSKGKKWFGVGESGHLYERYQVSSGQWHWADHGRPASLVQSTSKFPFVALSYYNSEPCAIDDELHLTTNNGDLYLRFYGPPWMTYNHGRIFGSVSASGCSTVYKPGLQGRTFVRGSNGHLYERYWHWTTRYTWRWVGRPITWGSSSLVASIKTTSYLYSKNGYSIVLVVGTDGNMWQLTTHQKGWGWWRNRGRPRGKAISKIHATRYGLWWAVTTDGSVCRYHGGWPCISPPGKKPILDCSDPYHEGRGRRSMFCVANEGILNNKARLYKLTVSGGGSSLTSTWAEYNEVKRAKHVDRPNVAFEDTNPWPVVQTPKSVFVSTTKGVFELRF